MQGRTWGTPSASPSCSQGPGVPASSGSVFILRVSPDWGPAWLSPRGHLRWVLWGIRPAHLLGPDQLPSQRSSAPSGAKRSVRLLPQAAWRLQDAGLGAQRPQRLSSRCPRGQMSRTEVPAWRGLERSPPGPLAVASHRRRGRGRSGPFSRVLIPFWGLHSHDPKGPTS